jgi:hypothetical protein
MAERDLCVMAELAEETHAHACALIESGETR